LSDKERLAGTSEFEGRNVCGGGGGGGGGGERGGTEREILIEAVKKHGRQQGKGGKRGTEGLSLGRMREGLGERGGRLDSPCGNGTCCS